MKGNMGCKMYDVGWKSENKNQTTEDRAKNGFFKTEEIASYKKTMRRFIVTSDE